jgi:hypothetical protein
MLPASRERILKELADDALVLDVGGGGQPFARADWVIDLLPYARRGLYGPEPDPTRERFGPQTWVVRDICDRLPWPFAEKQFDFAVSSHTLEDVRDPLFVCAELIRVARAGYIEVPSRLEEQTFGFQGPWAGWGHHRWLIDLDGDELTFVFKHHVLHGRPQAQFDAAFRAALLPEQRVHALWWRGTFRFRERIFLDNALDAYLDEIVIRSGARPRGPTQPARRPLRARLPGRLSRARGGRPRT